MWDPVGKPTGHKFKPLSLSIAVAQFYSVLPAGFYIIVYLMNRFLWLNKVLKVDNH